MAGVQNTIADSISCYHMQVFRELAPLADPFPTSIPAALKTLLSLDHQAWLLPAWRGLLSASSVTASQ